MLRITINPVLVYSFSRISCTPTHQLVAFPSLPRYWPRPSGTAVLWEQLEHVDTDHYKNKTAVEFSNKDHRVSVAFPMEDQAGSQCSSISIVTSLWGRGVQLLSEIECLLFSA
jgi:hypothetical protein